MRETCTIKLHEALFHVALSMPVMSGRTTCVCDVMLHCCGVQSDWEIVERGWKAHVLGEAEHTFKDALEAVKTLKVQMSVSDSMCTVC